MKIIYLDNNATTQIDRDAQDAMIDAQGRLYGNASSVHKAGYSARAALEKARAIIAGLIGAFPNEVYFTSGGTESNSMAMENIYHCLGRPAAVSVTEHPSVYNVVKDAVLNCESAGVFVLPVNSLGRVKMDAIDALEDPGLVAVMLANNETGTIQPIEDIARRLPPSCLLHVDACQAFGKIHFDAKRLGADTMSLCAHKLHGPKGVGALFIRQGVTVPPMLVGGNQERGMRPGTENVPGAVGFAVAAERACAFIKTKTRFIRGMKEDLWRILNSNLSQIRLNSPEDEAMCLPNTLNVSFAGVDSSALIMMLAESGVCVSAGSACHAGVEGPSRVLKAMQIEEKWLNGAIRFSLSRMNTPAEIQIAADHVIESVKGLRAMGARVADQMGTDRVHRYESIKGNEVIL